MSAGRACHAQQKHGALQGHRKSQLAAVDAVSMPLDLHALPSCEFKGNSMLHVTAQDSCPSADLIPSCLVPLVVSEGSQPFQILLQEGKGCGCGL